MFRLFLAALLLFATSAHADAVKNLSYNPVTKSFNAITAQNGTKVIQPNVWTAVVETASTACAASPCAIGDSYGMTWGTLARGGAGIYTANFQASFWSADPVCTVSPNNGGVAFLCTINGHPTTSSVGIVCFNSTNAVALDSGWALTCTGPRIL